MATRARGLTGRFRIDGVDAFWTSGPRGMYFTIGSMIACAGLVEEVCFLFLAAVISQSRFIFCLGV